MAIHITVKGGICQGGTHAVGQVFVVDRTTPEAMCLGAWGAIAPYVTALRFGASFPWEEEEGLATIHCPDPKGITLELRRASL
jgi:uncharacterized repeat protein (TIGR04076 family)